MQSPITENAESLVTPVVAGAGKVDQAAAESQPNQPTNRQSARAKVLIVEDDPRSARLVSAYLESAGYRATIANCATEAQSSMEAALPDLVLCDVCLPDMDGIQLTKWVREKFTRVNLPIALITSSDDSRILARGLEVGADDFLAKPVNALELRTRVRSLLRSKSLADELLTREEAALPFRYAESPCEGTHASAGEAARPERRSVVIIEDNPQERRLVTTLLRELRCETREAESAESGLALVREQIPGLIVLDLVLPNASGYDVIAAIKHDPRYDHVPILVVSGLAEVQDRVKALELGADDFIVKGFERVEFEARVRRLLRLNESLERLSNRCHQALQMAVTDSLTGLFTYGFMKETLRSQLTWSQRYGKPYAIIFGDVDHFKQVNDRYGHAAGDTVLRKVAETLSGIVRQSDTLVRYGGEEFVALLPHTDSDDAAQLAERMREAIANLEIRIDDNQSLRVTISLGIASYPAEALDAETLLQRGDEAMYVAKQAGRNCVAKSGITQAEQSGGARILLVDDDDKNLRLLEAFLTPAGYEVLYAHDGCEAIELMRKQQPDLVIMDGLMPGMSGFEACQRLKQDPRTKFVPVVLVTALNSREDKLRGIEAGADDFLPKPFDKTELLARVRALLRQKRGIDVLEDAETVVFALARAVEGRDPSLGDHVERVTQFAMALGRAVGLNQRDLEALRRASIVHDIGKITIPDEVLLKPGKLNPAERQIIERHAEAGFNLLQPLRTFSASLPAVRFHHERYDGSGYPLGLKGSEIPLLAQIIAIADVYDALSQDRCYRAALPIDEVCKILRDEASRGLHNPKLIETFVTQVVLGQGADSTVAAPPDCTIGHAEPSHYEDVVS